jgi:U3 small nucleolar RNA-associated protein 6
MTDKVNLHLEAMIPELQDYKEKELFTDMEIKQIVKKRRDFEYKIHRKIPKKEDFRRYIDYELHLEQLRLKRRQRYSSLPTTEDSNQPKKEKMSFSDIAIVQKLHQLYLKACLKFNEIDLWKEYLEWTIDQKSFHVFTRNVSKAIQLNPTQPLFWMMAANFEFQNGNMKNARVLMQKSLRCNPEIEKLWIEYCRLELLYLFKIKMRHQILFGNKDIETNEAVNMEELPDKENDLDLSPALQNTLKDLTIPKAIFKAALKGLFDSCSKSQRNIWIRLS